MVGLVLSLSLGLVVVIPTTRSPSSRPTAAAVNAVVTPTELLAAALSVRLRRWRHTRLHRRWCLLLQFAVVRSGDGGCWRVRGWRQGRCTSSSCGWWWWLLLLLGRHNWRLEEPLGGSALEHRELRVEELNLSLDRVWIHGSCRGQVGAAWCGASVGRWWSEPEWEPERAWQPVAVRRPHRWSKQERRRHVRRVPCCERVKRWLCSSSWSPTAYCCGGGRHHASSVSAAWEAGGDHRRNSRRRRCDRCCWHHWRPRSGRDCRPTCRTRLFFHPRHTVTVNNRWCFRFGLTDSRTHTLIWRTCWRWTHILRQSTWKMCEHGSFLQPSDCISSRQMMHVRSVAWSSSSVGFGKRSFKFAVILRYRKYDAMRRWRFLIETQRSRTMWSGMP